MSGNLTRKKNSVMDQLWAGVIDFENWADELLEGKRSEDNDFNPDNALASIARTDMVASRIIEEKIGQALTYISEERRWYAWDGRIHVPTESDTFVRHIIFELFDVFNEVLNEVDAYYEVIASRYRGSEDKDDKRKLAALNAKMKKVEKFKFYRDNIASSRGVSALVKQLEPVFSKDKAYFDNDRDYFVFRNGVLLTTEFREDGWPELRAHDPSRPVSKYFDAEWNHEVGERLGDSKFMHFLRTSVEGGDESVIEFLQETTGAAFMGRNKLRSIINLKGPPSSGKSLFLETIWAKGTQGSGYCVMPNSSAITRQQQNWEQSRMRGKRMIGISEPDTGKEIDDDFLKRFTGDVWVETRNLREKSHGWAPQGIIYIASNDYLKINTRDKAIVDRIHIVNFPYQFVPNPDPNNPDEKQRNTKLTDELQTEEEGSMILYWIVEGMKKFHLKGEVISPPESIKNTSNQVVTEGSAATRWIVDQIDQGTLVREVVKEPYAHMKLSEAWYDFSIWNNVNNEHSRLSKSYFEQDIGQWYEIRRFNGEKYIIGLRKAHMGVAVAPTEESVLV